MSDFWHRLSLLRSNLQVFLPVFLIIELILIVIVRGILHFSIGCNLPIIILSGVVAAVLTEELLLPWLRNRDGRGKRSDLI